MNLLLVLGAMIVAIVVLQFEGGAQSPSQDRIEARADADTYQFEQFATAAWTAARAGASGTIDRNALQLPAGFADGGDMQARTEGGYLYVWSQSPLWTASRLDQAQLDRVYPTADKTVNVGFSDAGSIYFRNGEAATKPGWLPSFLVIVRLRL